MNIKINAYIEGLIKYRNLLYELVMRDIKVRYRKSFLGILWTLLNPLLMMAVITAVFSTIFKSSIPNFPVYYLSGSVLFAFNAEATNLALFSIIGNCALIKKVYIPKYLFPLSRVLSSFVNLIFSFVAMILVMIFTGHEMHLTLFLTFIPLVFLILFTFGLSLILSALTVFFRDLSHLYGIFVMAWTYFTPLFYPVSIIPNKMMWVLRLNPMYYFINYFRELVLWGTFPSLKLNLVCFALGTFSTVLGLFVFYRKQDKFILYI